MTMMRSLTVCAALMCVVAAPASSVAASDEQPRLVLQITVDQLRGDVFGRFGDRFGPGGFRHLLENGTHYTNAHYRHANTETAPGHATLATGANPSAHGIVANDWIDRLTGAFVYNTEDDRHHLIGREPKAHEGVSPRNLLASTVGDELVAHTAGRSRVFSVSIKDRGAILPGGHAGKAFWLSRGDGSMVTSTFYYDEYPAWVAAWNEARPADAYKGTTWELLHDLETYVARDLDDRPFEGDFDVLGRTFPHALGDGSSKYFYTVLSLVPMGDELTLDFAKTLIDAEGVGQGDHVDYLQVSFSSPDHAGHLFGQASLEYEDTVLRLDRMLADLLAHVDRRVGLSRTLVVLSADHGGVEAPEHMQSLGFEAGRHPLDWFRRQNPLREPMRSRYGRDDLIEGHSHPYLYLDLGAIAEAGLDEAEVEAFVAAEAIRLPGIAYALTRSDLFAGRVAGAPLQDRIRRSFHARRSGHIHLVQEHYWLLHSTEEAEKLGVSSLAAIHGSPWAYDTYVPILFAGPGVPHATVARLVGPDDIAPTITTYLGVKPPSGSLGDLLVEVLPEGMPNP
jgi:predicted AlkP superfamily pyrophosphatase or phosphodiesterase